MLAAFLWAAVALTGQAGGQDRVDDAVGNVLVEPDTAEVATESAPAMAIWEAVVLGVVEGLTEYLPVSSTGHLLVTQEILGIGIESEAAREASYAYAICIQAGAIIAVLGLYWPRVRQGFRGLFGKGGIGQGDDDGWRMTVNLIVAFMPAAVIGILADDWIEARLAEYRAWPVVFAWFVGGVAILVTAAWQKKNKKDSDADAAKPLEGMTWKMALAIGFIQCIAMWPGTSRSLVTIVGGVLVGLSLAAAVEFSFLLGVITLCAATVYKAREAGPAMLEAYGWTPMLVGSFAAWVSAVIAVKWMVAYLKKHGMQVFGYYRIAIAIIVTGLIFTGIISL